MSNRKPPEGGDLKATRNPASGTVQDLDLELDIVTALEQPGPLGLLTYASTMIAGVDQVHDPGPFGPPPDADLPSLDELITMFRETALPATDALLLVLARLGGDELLRRRVAHEVAARGRSFPDWMDRLSEIHPRRAVLISHVLGDGDNILIDVDMPGTVLTVLLFVDHNEGSAAADGLAIDEPIDDVLRRMRSLTKRGDAELIVGDISLADARAKIEDAIVKGENIFPAFETETWPALRAMVEWLAAMMPAGGVGYQMAEVEIDDVQEQVAAFAASTHGRGLGHAEDSDIAETLLWLAANYFGGDMLRWSPATAELTLSELIPRKIHADRAYLQRMPEVLRRLVAYAHQQRGIPQELTRETLAAIERAEPEYLSGITRPQRLGWATLLADPGEDWAEDGLATGVTGGWEAAVGGPQAMAGLSTDPLPEEPLHLDRVPADVQARVRGIAELLDPAAEELFTLELRTAARRILTRVAEADPAILRRKSSDAGAAAAVLWIAATINWMFEGHRGGASVGRLQEYLGVASHPSRRAQPMLRALGVADPAAWMRMLGEPQWLVSDHRRLLRARWQTATRDT
ncbi:MAG: hypothetical protein ACK5KO_11805 [Arachnia sp.]